MSLAFSWHRPLGVGSPRSRLPPSLRSICPNWLSPVTCHVTPVEPSGLHYPERASANAGEDLNPREPLVGMGNGCAPGRSVPVRLPQDNTLPRRKGVVGGKKRRGRPFFLVRSCFSKLRSLDGHLKCVRAVLLSRCRSAGSSSLSDVPDLWGHLSDVSKSPSLSSSSSLSRRSSSLFLALCGE